MTYTITIEQVEHDDFGDKEYQWYAHLRKGSIKYWYDYWKTEPSLQQVIDTMQSALSEGKE